MSTTHPIQLSINLNDPDDKDLEGGQTTNANTSPSLGGIPLKYISSVASPILVGALTTLLQPGDIGAAKLCLGNRNALFSCVDPCEPQILSRYSSPFKRNPERVDFPCDSFLSIGFLARHDAGVLFCPPASSLKLSDIFGSHSKVVEGYFES